MRQPYSSLILSLAQSTKGSDNKNSTDAGNNDIVSDDGGSSDNGYEGDVTTKTEVRSIREPGHTPLGLELLQQQSEMLKSLMSSVADIFTSIVQLDSRIQQLELAVIKLDKHEAVDMTPEPVNRRSRRQSTNYPGPSSSIPKPIATTTSLSFTNAAGRQSVGGRPYQRRAQIFAVILVGMFEEIIRTIEHKRKFMFSLSLTEYTTKLSSVIEAICRNVPHLSSLPNYLDDTELLAKIARSDRAPLPVITAITINSFKLHAIYSDLYRYLSQIISSLKIVSIILPYPINLIVDGLDPMITEGTEFKVDLSSINSNKCDDYKTDIDNLPHSCKTSIIEQIIRQPYAAEDILINEVNANKMKVSSKKSSKRGDKTASTRDDGPHLVFL